MILDVGCGPGFWVRNYARRGFTNIHACDLTERAVDITKTSLEQFGLKAIVRIGNAEDLPYEDESFDYLNCQGVIHHTPNTRKCINEFFRVLKDNGHLVFSVYYRNVFLRNQLLLKVLSLILSKSLGLKGRGREILLSSGNQDEIVRIYDGMDNPIGKSFTKREVLGMAQDGGFRVLESARLYFPKRALPFPLPQLLHRFLHSHFGLMIALACQKP